MIGRVCDRSVLVYARLTLVIMAFIVGRGGAPAFRLRVKLTCRRSERQAHACAEHACAETILMSCYSARCAPKRIACAWEIWWTIPPAGLFGLLLACAAVHAPDLFKVLPLTSSFEP